MLIITEKLGTMKFVELASGRLGTLTGLPDVAYARQRALGDVDLM